MSSEVHKHIEKRIIPTLLRDIYEKGLRTSAPQKKKIFKNAFGKYFENLLGILGIAAIAP